MAGVPPKEANQQSLKRKASAQIMPKDIKNSRVTPYVIRNSFALEDAYNSWQKKNNNDNGSNKHAVKPNLNENRRRNSLPMVDKDGFQTVKNAAKVSSANSAEMAPPPVYNKFQLLDSTPSSNDEIINENEMDTESVSQSLENNEPLSSSQRQHTNEIPTPTVKSYRPPPIFVKGEKANATIGVLRSNNLDQEAFTVTMSKGLHSVQAKNQTTFETIKTVLIENNYQFYTFTPRGEKLKSLLLKGMSEDTTPEIVLEDLKAKNIPSVEFKKVFELKFKRGGEERRHLIVQITQTSSLKELLKIKHVCNLKARWERLRRSRILQCRKCQRLGHTAANCQMEYRCVKCGSSSHAPAQCPLTGQTTRENFKNVQPA
ncbi:hypothetical protein M0804_015337 [Polistes exclamans]|nr:hypothetical protein M0804_015337 [Polistes exclamans]